ncbi:MAG TPA: hypothetical protein VHW70_01950 [Edaphobacter sp.]|nr:hypothetical protein [Edaphobacter sp.]
MTSDERNQLARAWIALQTTPQHASEYNSLFWSFEQTYDLVREDPVEAWKLILTIWSLDRSLPTRQSLSRGPLEELLCFHGEYIIPEIERQAKADASFATLLGGVGQNTMPDPIWNRLQEAWIAIDGFTFLRTQRRLQAQAQREKLPPLEVLQSTLLEFAKLAALLLCLLSVYAVFHSLFFSIEDPQLFLQPHHTFVDRILGSLFLLGISAAISFVGGVIFREAEPPPHPSLAKTLPLLIFSWSTSIMTLFFFLAWFLETHYVFSPSVHW